MVLHRVRPWCLGHCPGHFNIPNKVFIFIMVVTTKNLLVKLPLEDMNTQNLWSNVVDFAERKGIANAVLTDDGNLLLSSTKKKIVLNSGMWTLKKSLALDCLPTRIEKFSLLPDKFVQEYFRDGYDADRIARRFGPMFEDAALKAMVYSEVEKKKNAVRNHKIATHSTMQLLQSGDVSYDKVALIDNNKKLVERIARQEVLNPDLDSSHVITFKQWKPSEEDKSVFVPTGLFPPIDLTIRGRPGSTDVKYKHCYVYSKKPGFGKTYAMERFKDQYNAHFVNDTNNWMSVPRKAQFLIFEEVSVDNKLGLSELKTLTSGSASGFRANCKSHGESFEPRSDVQVVMLSNKSIYEVYGTWNAKLQCRFISKDLAQQFEQRFEIVCLDDDVNADKLSCTDPVEWTEEECHTQLVKLFKVEEDGFRGERTVEKVKATLKVACNVKALYDAKYQNCVTKKMVECFSQTIEGLLPRPSFGLRRLKVADVIRSMFCHRTDRVKTGKEWQGAIDMLVRQDDGVVLLPDSEESKAETLLFHRKNIMNSLEYFKDIASMRAFMKEQCALAMTFEETSLDTLVKLVSGDATGEVTRRLFLFYGSDTVLKGTRECMDKHPNWTDHEKMINKPCFEAYVRPRLLRIVKKRQLDQEDDVWSTDDEDGERDPKRLSCGGVM